MKAFCFSTKFVNTQEAIEFLYLTFCNYPQNKAARSTRKTAAGDEIGHKRLIAFNLLENARDPYSVSE